MKELKEITNSSEENKEILMKEYISDMYKVAKTRLYNDDDIYDAIL